MTRATATTSRQMTGGGNCLCNKNGTRQPSGRQLFQVGRVNSSQDGLVVSSDGIAPCHSAGHGNTPKIKEDETENTTSNEKRIY
jgi:hypothetical protein